MGWMEEKSGSIKSVKMKSIAVNSVLNPVRPPCSTPAADSTNEVTVESPKSAPRLEKIASTCRVFSSLVSSSNIRLPMPLSVPMESKMSVTKKAMTTGMTAKVVNAVKFSSKIIGEIDAGIEKRESGILERPVNQAMTAPVTMAMIKAP